MHEPFYRVNVADRLDTPVASSKKRATKKRRFWRRLLIVLAVLSGILVAARLAAPTFVRNYVNDVIDQNPLYDGEIGDVSIHLYRGAYSIENIRIVKTTGGTVAPLFAAKRMDLAIEWGALLKGKVVGKIRIAQPELNFADGDDQSEDQTGAGGPWLGMIQDLFPFDINSCQIVDGSIHFRAIKKDPPVDMYMNKVNASIDNLTNVYDEMTKNVATVEATGLVLDHAQFKYKMEIDPFSYRPTFTMAMQLVGLDVTKTNPMARAYGQFDFEDGWFDLVVEVDAKEGYFDGYVKPLFRNLKVISLQDVKEDNVLTVFWEALIGGVTKVLSNPPRDQFGTLIPMSGDLTSPDTDLLATLGNIVHNAFIRAYLPRLEPQKDSNITFKPGQEIDPASASIDSK
jgi:hypothetical protein